MVVSCPHEHSARVAVRSQVIPAPDLADLAELFPLAMHQTLHHHGACDATQCAPRADVRYMRKGRRRGAGVGRCNAEITNRQAHWVASHATNGRVGNVAIWRGLAIGRRRSDLPYR